ncbi:MAG: hypothetical protein A2744_03985 [Candidatus Buchananbacteria bacterium RIFCSPHIGHO2_01_FULL_44_11]|uniref:Multidrug ABC transporter substrate-binding protein n=1 Tax=Candidatus Buchananbacteria bacterium RIFCSPHIGHO2_01_FULL_44_11 TaxID=1797535 RepID=A0A1G1Y2K7_9BACT|nr:MAG: hypothetical protein A2744_03985 [Candidatus Buchananbacteria bacterium RIFCSPHIGHO2_01_FULL_44_11]
MIANSLKIALMALKRNRVRTSLTVLGVVIGIAAVITVMSAGEGVQGFVLNQVETFGTDLIQVEIKVPSAGKTSTDNAMGLASGIEITTLKLSDQAELNNLPNIKNSYAAIMGQQLVSFGGQNKQIYLMGVSAPFIDIDKTKLATGRFFSDEEDRGLANVAVLGPKVKEKIFGESDYLDKWIKIGHQKFLVVGLMESRGASFGFDMDDMIFVPVRTLQKKILGIDHVQWISFQVYDNSIAKQTAEEMSQVLRELHDIDNPDRDDFHATSMTEALEILGSVFWAISLLLIAIASISLIVGGVGIMNIMYVSVMERTYEIGLRKAVGANSKNILAQFLWEAIIITLLGALFGIVVGILMSALVAIVANSQGFPWRFVVTPFSLFLSCGVAIVIGIAFGVFPAKTAASLDPVEALRYNR